MTTKIRRAFLFLALTVFTAYAELESQRLQRLAARGVQVAEKSARLERRVAEAVKRIDEEARERRI